MKIKLALLLASVGIISATAFGATAASWAVTDNAGSFGIKIGVESVDRKIFLNTGGSSLWEQGNAWFAAWCFDGEPKASEFVKLDACVEANYYSFSLDPAYKSILFSRQKPDSDTASWENQWNQTVDITVSGSYDTYTITGWGDESTQNKSTVSASKHNTCIPGTPVIENETEETCTTDGGYDLVKYCTICGKKVSSEHVTIPAHHTIGDQIPEEPATCTEDGIEAHYECSVCNKLFTDALGLNETTLEELKIDALGHDFVSAWSHDASNHWHQCSRCDAKDSVGAHAGGQATEEHGAICEVCGFEYTEPLAHTHDYVEHPAVAPTCTQAGNEKYYTCNGCQKIFNESKVEIPAIPTIAALGHNMTEHPATPATCTADGNTLYYSCSRCNKYFSDNLGNTEIVENSWVISKTGHSFAEAWSSDSTHHWHVCENSGCTETTTKEAHTFGFDEKCTVCGYQDTNVYTSIRVYDGDTLVGQYHMQTNADNANEMMVTNVSMKKGYKAVAYRNSGTGVWFGSATSYTHNLSVAANKNTKLTNDSGNYIACQDGTYDFYVKFNESTHTNYASTHVNVDDVRTIYCTANWSDIDPNRMWVNYEGDNVIATVDSYKPQMIYSHKNDQNQTVNKVIIPSKAGSIQFCYNKTDNSYVKSSLTILGSHNAYYFSDWNGGSPTMGTWDYSA